MKKDNYNTANKNVDRESANTVPNYWYYSNVLKEKRIGVRSKILAFGCS